MVLIICLIFDVIMAEGIKRMMEDEFGLTSVEKERIEWEKEGKETCFMYEGGIPVKELVEPTAPGKMLLAKFRAEI